MKSLFEQVNEIKANARLDLIRSIHQKVKTSKPSLSFSTAMHSVSEKEDTFSFVDQSVNIDFPQDENLDDSYSSAFG